MSFEASSPPTASVAPVDPPSAARAISKIRRVKLREVWPHEALDFTTWLEQNPDALNDVLDVNLDSIERELAAGAFNVDLTAEDDAGNRVIIENQLERSN